MDIWRLATCGYGCAVLVGYNRQNLVKFIPAKMKSWIGYATDSVRH